MDFNQLLSLAKKNQEKNEKNLLKPNPKPSSARNNKKHAQTLTFCKPYVKPPPKPHSQSPVRVNKKALVQKCKNTIKQEKNNVSVKSEMSQPKSFAELLSLAKKNVNTSSNSKNDVKLQNHSKIDSLQSLGGHNSKNDGNFPKSKVNKSGILISHKTKMPIQPIRPIKDTKQSVVKIDQSKYSCKQKMVNPIKNQNNINKNKISNNSVSKSNNFERQNRFDHNRSMSEKLSVKKQPQVPTSRPNAFKDPRSFKSKIPAQSGIAAQLGGSSGLSNNVYFDEDFESDDYDSDFIDDSEITDDLKYTEVVKIIQQTMNFDPSKYAKVNKYDDLKNMESSYRQLEKENARSAKLGAKEDREDMLLELEKKKRKVEKK